MLPLDAKATEKAPYVSICTDGSFLYLHSEIEGLLKIGTGFQYTMLGKVYAHKPDWRLKERGTLVFIFSDSANSKGKMFYRSPRVVNTPLIQIDISSLEEVILNHLTLS